MICGAKGFPEALEIPAPKKNAARFIVALYGISAFGRVLVPINFRLTRDDILYIVEHSGSTVLLVDPELESLVADVPIAHRLIMGEATDAQLFGRDRTPRHTVFDGYYEQPDETARVIVDGWFHTGDGGHLDGARVN